MSFVLMRPNLVFKLLNLLHSLPELRNTCRVLRGGAPLPAVCTPAPHPHPILCIRTPFTELDLWAISLTCALLGGLCVIYQNFERSIRARVGVLFSLNGMNTTTHRPFPRTCVVGNPHWCLGLPNGIKMGCSRFGSLQSCEVSG